LKRGLFLCEIEALTFLETFTYLLSLMRNCLCSLLFILSLNVCGQHIDFYGADFREPDSIASLYMGHSLRDREVLTHKLTDSLATDLQKFRSIFRWIAENITYDVDLYYKNIENTQRYRRDANKLKAWQAKFSKQTQRNVLAKKLAVCDGYASLLEEMCSIANIPCKKIIGYARTALVREPLQRNHAWNAVRIANKWYLSDPTWATGGVSNDDHRFRKSFEKGYFLADPDFMKLKHFPQDSAWFLLKDKPDYSVFSQYPLVYSQGFSKSKLNMFFPATGFIKAKKNEPVIFRFTSNLASVERIGLIVSNHKKAETIAAPSVERDREGMYQASYTFQEKGLYKVDLLVNHHYVLAYEITVK
jgi:transglutaminase-like putative cysteine protease